MTILETILDELQSVNASDIIVYDTAVTSPYYDHMVVASVTSNRQLEASMRRLKDALSKAGIEEVKVEGNNKSEWMLLDSKDIIVNVFLEESRSYYNIERLYADLPHKTVQ